MRSGKAGRTGKTGRSEMRRVARAACRHGEESIARRRWLGCLLGTFWLLVPCSIAAAGMPTGSHLNDRRPLPQPKLLASSNDSRTRESTNASATDGVEVPTDEGDPGDVASSTAVALGLWGGEHIGLDVAKSSAKVEFDCAFGTIDEQLRVSEKGRFEVRGTYGFEFGGPTRAGDPPPRGRPAIYRGRVDGDEMHLTVIMSDSGREIGPFLLKLGTAPHLEKCV